MGQKARRSSRCKPCIASGTTKCLASAGLFFCFGCGRFFSPSWEDSSSGKGSVSTPALPFFICRPDQIADNKKPARRPVSLLSCAPPGNAWEVRMVLGREPNLWPKMLIL
ncbi:hypothetical protein HMPREF3150_01161 [Pseudomonas aeruginosa]|nr:hypothetical protein HMPREF3150_01161 [Pseudomonas aeruginosa]